ncbi:hypothetical protein IPL85_03295 [Candidatus Saccharibacteria bacterium]|nr:MAG: hypothetical protein IPL85_03295 [Candidatus Saccharibacteria bacterium]
MQRFSFRVSKQGVQVALAVSLLLLPLFFLTRGYTGVEHAYAATSDNLNFQARLENSAGAIAADGFYNLQFKLYDAASGGTLLWTETYDYNGGTPDRRVRVANGYVTVNLGSITSFPGSMPWDQQLYLTMNVGGTGTSASWDGEMNPRLKLTAVPYAFNAKTASQLVTTSGVFISTLAIQSPTGGNQTLHLQNQGAAGTYNLLTAPSRSDGYIKLQTGTPGTAQTGHFNISGTGIAAILRGSTSVLTPILDTAAAGTLTIGGTNASSISLADDTVLAANKTITITGGDTTTRNGLTPTEGMVFYDTTTKQLLIYANGKWQADRETATKIVAPSTASQALKDAADYVATGSADQTIINTALTAAAGGKVVLLEGTFTTSDAISIPNNTTLAGNGRGTLVTFSNIATQNKNMITNTDTTNGEGVVVRDLRLDGNKAVNTSGTQHGII